jgi:hypothetical protein
MDVASPMLDEVRRRFKLGGLWDTLPAVAMPALGVYLGEKYMPGPTGKLIGGIAGGLGGAVTREAVLEAQQRQQWQQQPPFQSAVPPGAPFAIDSTAKNIPPWALAGAQALGPVMKQGSSGIRDVLLGDTMGSAYPLVDPDAQGHRLKSMGYQTAGVMGGGALGHGVGALADRIVGKKINVPGINLPLSQLLAGLGATIGGLKGTEWARG